jgi:hypothetical protein
MKQIQYFLTVCCLIFYISANAQSPPEELYRGRLKKEGSL